MVALELAVEGLGPVGNMNEGGPRTADCEMRMTNKCRKIA